MSMFNRKIKLQFNKMKYAPLIEDSKYYTYKIRILFEPLSGSQGKCDKVKNTSLYLRLLLRFRLHQLRCLGKYSIFNG